MPIRVKYTDRLDVFPDPAPLATYHAYSITGNQDMAIEISELKLTTRISLREFSRIKIVNSHVCLEILQDADIQIVDSIVNLSHHGSRSIKYCITPYGAVDIHFMTITASINIMHTCYSSLLHFISIDNNNYSVTSTTDHNTFNLMTNYTEFTMINTGINNYRPVIVHGNDSEKQVVNVKGKKIFLHRSVQKLYPNAFKVITRHKRVYKRPSFEFYRKVFY